MARYIDVEALKNDGHPCWHDGEGNIYYEVDHAPTADVVEVVRCKNCKHKVDYCGRLMCGRNKYEFAEGVGGLVATLPEHFCSYGDRRDT